MSCIGKMTLFTFKRTFCNMSIVSSCCANEISLGSGCASVGRVLAFDTRGLQFESSQRQNFLMYKFTVEKTTIKKKRPEKANEIGFMLNFPVIEYFAIIVYAPVLGITFLIKTNVSLLQLLFGTFLVYSIWISS